MPSAITAWLGAGKYTSQDGWQVDAGSQLEVLLRIWTRTSVALKGYIFIPLLGILTAWWRGFKSERLKREREVRGVFMMQLPKSQCTTSAIRYWLRQLQRSTPFKGKEHRSRDAIREKGRSG